MKRRDEIIHVPLLVKLAICSQGTPYTLIYICLAVHSRDQDDETS